MTPDQKRKSIFLALIGALVFPGLYIVHQTWLVKEPGDDRKPDAPED
jgi:hypothetical protein